MDKPTSPKWSVMIPAYGKGQYLEQTLRSVLAQAPGPEHMQIAVVENPSGNDEIRQVVKRVGGRRVEYLLNEKNLGMVGNWNRCIERARGEFVHLLHDDDYVQDGFYSRLASVMAHSPGFALYATRSTVISSTGATLRVTDRVSQLENGGRYVDAFFYGNPVQAAGVVVRRNFYVQNGVFIPELVYCADCEMWARAVGAGGGLVLPDNLAYYRVHSDGGTSQMSRTGETARDLFRLNQIYSVRYPNFDSRRGNRYAALVAWSQFEEFARLNDISAAAANLAIWRERAPWWLRWIKSGRRFASVIRSSLRKGLPQ